MGIPDHLTCLLRNLYVGQETTVRTGHGTTDWFQIEKGVCQGCILSPWIHHVKCWQSLGQEDPLEKEMETRYSILAWRIPWTEKPDRLQSMGSQRVRHDWATNTLKVKGSTFPETEFMSMVFYESILLYLNCETENHSNKLFYSMLGCYRKGYYYEYCT